jgi:chorismate mutase
VYRSDPDGGPDNERGRSRMSIDKWRGRIDEIDRKLVQLLNERSQCAIEIGKLKRELQMHVYDPGRERDVIRNAQQENHGPLDDDGLRRLFERIIDECRRIERETFEKE